MAFEKLLTLKVGKTKSIKTMKKKVSSDMLPEYDFSNGVRGKYAKRFAEGSNIVLLSLDVYKNFPDSNSVNKALRTLTKNTQRNR